MANIKFLLMVFALVFVMFASHQALSEQDYHEDKEKLLTICWDTIKIDGAYVPPTAFCRYFVKKKVNMACVCRLLNPANEVTTSAVKLVHLAHDCGKALLVGSKCGNKYLYICAHV
jgi:hypothetical protein